MPHATDVAAWEIAERYLDINHEGWKSLHITDLSEVLSNRWDQEGVYAIYVELMTRHKLAANLDQRAYLRRTAQAFYLAMDGAFARRTFSEEFKKAIARPFEMRLGIF